MKRLWILMLTLVFALALSSCSDGGTAQLTRDEALEIAYTDAGVTADQASNVQAEFDLDDGVPSWEIEFRSGFTEYKYDIAAETGTILERDVERFD